MARRGGMVPCRGILWVSRIATTDTYMYSPACSVFLSPPIRKQVVSRIRAQLYLRILTSFPRSSRSSLRFPRGQPRPSSYLSCIKYPHRMLRLSRAHGGVMGIASLTRRKYRPHKIPTRRECLQKKKRYSQGLRLQMWNLKRHGMRSYGASPPPAR